MGETARIWWGAIASERQAREIIAWAAWSLILIGMAPVAAVSVGFAQGEIALAAPYWTNAGDNWYVLGQVAFIATVLSAAVLLLRTQSWVSALVLLVACVFVVALIGATIFKLVETADLTPSVLTQHLILSACVLVFTYLVCRAMAAAQSLPRLRLAEQFA